MTSAAYIDLSGLFYGGGQSAYGDVEWFEHRSTFTTASFNEGTCTRCDSGVKIIGHASRVKRDYWPFILQLLLSLSIR